MMNKLRIRFIAFSALALLLLQALIIGFTAIRTYRKMSESADQIINTIYHAYPETTDSDARYFTVTFDASGAVIDIDLAHIVTVKRKGADAHAKSILSGGKEHGFTDSFRYGVFKEAGQQRTAFALL